MIYNSRANICGCSSLKAFDFPGIEPLQNNGCCLAAEDDVFVSRYFQNLNGFIDDMKPSEPVEADPLLEIDERIDSALRKRGLVVRYPSIEDNEQLGDVLVLANGGNVSDFVMLKNDSDLIKIEFWDKKFGIEEIRFHPLQPCENDVDILCQLEGRAKVVNDLYRCIVLEDVQSRQIEGAIYYYANVSNQARGEIILFAVRDESQNKGYGNILLTSALSDLAKHDCQRVKLSSTLDPGALVTYLKFGFLPKLTLQQKLVWKGLDLLNQLRVLHLDEPILELDMKDPEFKTMLQSRKNRVLEDPSLRGSKQVNPPITLAHVIAHDLSDEIVSIFKEDF